MLKSRDFQIKKNNWYGVLEKKQVGNAETASTCPMGFKQNPSFTPV